MKYSRFLTSILLISFLTSCVKDYFDFDKVSNHVDWNPNVAAPAVHSKLTLRDLLQDYDVQHLFVEDTSHFLYLIYNKQVFSLPASQYVSIPNQSLSQNFSANDFTTQGFPTTSPVVVTKTIQQILQIQSPTDVIDSLIFKYGTFHLELNSTFQHTGLLTVTFPTIRKNGLPYSKTVNINSSNGFNYSNDFNDLVDYQFTTPTSNQLVCEVTLTLTNAGHPVLPTDQAQVNMNFSNIQYKLIYGYFGNRVIPVQEDTVNVEIFNNALNGQLYFMDPKIKFNLFNSFGVPLGATFTDFKIYSSSDQSYHPYSIPSQYNPLIVNAPTVAGNNEITNILLDTSNFPTIRDIIYNNPRYFYLKTTAMMNPPSTSQYNFLTDTSRFAVNLEVELPLWGRSTKWVLQDTADFDFSEYYKDSTVDLNNIEYVRFNINMLNAMPTKAGVQLYFTDSLFNVIDSMFTPQNMEIVQSGVINGYGKVIQPTRKITQITYTGNRLSGLSNVKKILIRGYINTYNQGNTNVRFYSDNYLDVKLGVQVQAKVNTQTDFNK
ncbi:MAG: hypothetical protein HPY79_01435 [Bacteroidales bacterium]|nr:hypothetical protein [Bacteroidales bacterium]